MISVIIPVYNKAHTLPNTLTSVINQTFSNFEVIIIDDCSTDNSVDVIKKFLSDKRFKLITQENKGVAITRNNGAAAAKFKYFVFLDADDEWKPDFLLKVAEAINTYPIAGMFCVAGIIDNGDNTYTDRLDKNLKDKITPIRFFHNPHVYYHTSATVLKKEFFDKVGGFPKKIWDEDFYLSYSIALIADVIYLGFQLSIYHGNISGQSTGIIYNEDGSFRKDPVNRHNLVFKNWELLGKKNKDYPVFLKYELRHTIKIYILNNDYSRINSLFTNLSSEILKQFSFFEKSLYRLHRFKTLALLYINYTKIFWRLHKYPVTDTTRHHSIN